MTKSIYDLQYSELYYGSMWLKIGIASQLLVGGAIMEFPRNLFSSVRANDFYTKRPPPHFS